MIIDKSKCCPCRTCSWIMKRVIRLCFGLSCKCLILWRISDLNEFSNSYAIALYKCRCCAADWAGRLWKHNNPLTPRWYWIPSCVSAFPGVGCRMTYVMTLQVHPPCDGALTLQVQCSNIRTTLFQLNSSAFCSQSWFCASYGFHNKPRLFP